MSFLLEITSFEKSHSIYLPTSISQRGITRLEVPRDDAPIGGGGCGGGEIDGGLMVNDDE